MNKAIIIALLFAPVFAPITISAATVQVVPSLVNSHGGTATGKDLRVCITQGSFNDCGVDMPTFTLTELGEYHVDFFPPAGYTYEANYRCANGTKYDYKEQKEVCNGTPDRTITCSGTIDETNVTSSKMCYVNYYDDAPIVEVPPPAPVVIIQQVPAPIEQATSPVITLPVSVIAAEGATTTMTQAEQIASLQAQILELYNILIALLIQKLAVLTGN